MNTTRPDTKSIEREVEHRTQRDDTSLSRWSPASWLNLLLEKRVWLSAGLVWMNGASVSGARGVFEESHPDGLESRPTINLFEQWEEGAHVPKLVNARDFSFPKSLVVPYAWMYAPRALSLSEAVSYVSQHEERDAWGQASRISLVAGTNYPNQPERNPSSHLSDPLTYWWGATLCPLELNDVSLAENVVIVRTQGVYTAPTNPWPRDPEKEERDITGVQERKPVYRRQGPSNRWDQYGESSSAASSEAHIASEQVSMESRWSPWTPSEPANRDKRPAQPYRLQKANKSDGQWSRWASDIRQSQPDQ